MKDPGHSSKMTPSCKWPIMEAKIIHQKVTDKRGSQQNHNLNSHKLRKGVHEYYFAV